MKRKVIIICTVGMALLGLGMAQADDLFDVKTSESHFQKGLQHYFQQQYQAAVNEFEQTLSINPDDARGYFFLGYSYYKLGEVEKARKAFEQAYQMDPQYSPIPKAVHQDN